MKRVTVTMWNYEAQLLGKLLEVDLDKRFAKFEKAKPTRTNVRAMAIAFGYLDSFADVRRQLREVSK